MYLLFPGEYLHFDDPGKLLSVYLIGFFIRKADYLELVGVRNHDFRNCDRNPYAGRFLKISWYLPCISSNEAFSIKRLLGVRPLSGHPH